LISGLCVRGISENDIESFIGIYLSILASKYQQSEASDELRRRWGKGLERFYLGFVEAMEKMEEEEKIVAE
jgi:hypothetical protein